PPAEPEPPGVQHRVRAALDEAVELLRGAVGLADAPEGLAEPETDVAREQPGDALHAERLPRGHRLVVTAQRIARQRETVSRPRLHRHRHRAREELSEDVASAGGVAEAERGPGASVRGPATEVARLRRGLHDLTEQPVRGLDPSELPIRLGEPVACLEHEVLVRAAARRLLEHLRRILVLGLGDARATALEGRI